MDHTCGWDVSTSIVGVATVDASGKLVRKAHVDLRKVKGLNDKLRAVRSFVRSSPWLKGCGSHVVEDRLSGFTPGKSSAGTLLHLAAFNAMVSFVIEDELKVVPVHVHPSTAKAALRRVGLEFPKGADKKELTLAWSRQREGQAWSVDLNRNGNEQPWCYDEADAYGLAIVGWSRDNKA